MRDRGLHILTWGRAKYQMQMMQALEGLEGIIVVADDIMVFGEGSTEKEAEIEHDKN